MARLRRLASSPADTLPATALRGARSGMGLPWASVGFASRRGFPPEGMRVAARRAVAVASAPIYLGQDRPTRPLPIVGILRAHRRHFPPEWPSGRPRLASFPDLLGGRCSHVNLCQPAPRNTPAGAPQFCTLKSPCAHSCSGVSSGLTRPGSVTPHSGFLRHCSRLARSLSTRHRRFSIRARTSSTSSSGTYSRRWLPSSSRHRR